MENKRAIIKLMMIIVILLIVGFIFYLKKFPVTESNENYNKTLSEYSCQSNEDCVPDSCCHASSCISKQNAPECEGKTCTLDCQPGTLDCGQGKCECINNKCATSIKVK